LLLTNLAQTRVRGVDLTLNGHFNGGEYGRFNPSLNVTYNHSTKLHRHRKVNRLSMQAAVVSHA
jgi:outer membrane receptor protein involved in Fe transport